MTQDQLAEKIPVTPKTVSRWENGKTIPGTDMIPKIAEALGISVADLLGQDAAEDQDAAEEKRDKKPDVLNTKIDSLSEEMRGLYTLELKSFIGTLERRIRIQKKLTVVILAVTVILIAIMTYRYWTL